MQGFFLALALLRRFGNKNFDSRGNFGLSITNYNKSIMLKSRTPFRIIIVFPKTITDEFCFLSRLPGPLFFCQMSCELIIHEYDWFLGKTLLLQTFNFMVRYSVMNNFIAVFLHLIFYACKVQILLAGK